MNILNIIDSLSAIVSFCSLSWAIGTYTKAMQKINPDNNEATWIVLILQGLWRAGMLISRIAVLVLTAVCLRQWSLLFLGFHWLFMTIWVLLQNTNFCPTIWEERIYNCIIGLIYCFDFFNLRIDIIKTEKIIIMTSFIIGGMMIGLTSMLFYYGKFHPSKVGNISETGDKKSEIVTNKAVTPRSFKQYYPNSFTTSSCSIDRSQRTTSEEITTDKQYLLTNIVQNSECTENGIINQTCQIENDSPSTAVCVVSECESAHNNISKDENPSSNILPNNAFSIADNTCEYLEIHDDHNNSCEKDIHRQKRRGICLPTIHGLDIDKDVSTKDSNSCLPLQKRRGICFSNQLILEMESNDQGKLITNRNLILDISTKHDELENCSLSNICKDLNSITMLRDRMETPTIFNESCEKTEETEKLTKELQQRDETMSCVTSIHDYENVCPLGVARPPWCIRSWKGYTDIETYIHDDSVVRDRRRDTLTSTTTGTTYSSEFSDTTCASSILRGILKQDDYLDTLTYDLIDSRELKTAYSEDISTKRIADVDEQNSILYIAKPVVIDDKGGMFALDTILEEHDEMATEEKFEYNQSNCDSVSTLVSTIDQIRKYTAENSPRHVYHTTGSQWEDFDPKNLIKKAQLTKALFKTDLKDPVTCSRNYINCLEESESIIREKDEIDAIKDLVKYCTIESIKKTPLIDAILSDSPILGNKTKLQKQAFISSRKDESDSKENDLYVEMSPLVPVENVKIVHNNLSDTVSPNITNVNSDSADTKRLDTTSYISTQLVKSNSDNTEKLEPICDKLRKKPINYPKRKFSLLKEKFESKSQLVYVVTPNKAIKIGQSTASPEIETSKKNVSVILKKSSDYIKYDKENLAPIASFKVCYEKNTSNDKSHSNRENIDLIYENDKSLCNNDLNLKERRHIFLEQVLSPPKLLTWNKKKSFSGSTAKCFCKRVILNFIFV
ncbi:XK-related protein [Apis cerana cerana]|uniref:XK-related protein n=1 Tax=Apis cerana cerana TaxID=94128 RepID=A0A2A3EMV3_APICC|nr:XK-related protein [Apis cerana cerana]